MSGNRILIPGLYDSSDESENEDGPADQPAEDVLNDRTTPEASGEDVVEHQEDEDCFESPSVETAQEEEEEEAEYDPLDAPFLIRKPQKHGFMPDSGGSNKYEEAVQHTASEAPQLIEQHPMEAHEEEEEETGQHDNYFVVDAHSRCVRIMPGGFDENAYVALEKIPAESWAMLNERVHSPNLEDDDHFYCEQCVMSFRVCCVKHPLYRIMDRSVSGPVHDRATKTLPAFIRIKTSSIPNAGLGAFTNCEIPVGIVFGPYQGILSKESDNRGYSWEIRNADGPSVFLDGSDPKYGNWMRYINSPRYDREQNLVAFQYNGSVYYRVIRPIDAEQELLVWYGAKYGESLGVFSTKRSSNKSRSIVKAEVKNPFIM